jgi:predicted AlkP superfamily phosphohydrolase/phosphomutase
MGDYPNVGDRFVDEEEGIYIRIVSVSKAKEIVTYEYEIDGERQEVSLFNWLVTKTFGIFKEAE